MSLAHSPSVVTSGLVLYADAGNTKSYPGSGTTWFDISGSGHHLDLVNSPTYSSTTGRFTFASASQQYATTNSTAALTTANPSIIIACTVASGTVLAKGSYGVYWNYGLSSLTSTTFKLRNDTGDTLSPTMDAVSGLNVFAGVWNGTACEFYRNGIYWGQSSLTYRPKDTNSQFLRVGCAWTASSSTNTEFYNGSIASIMIYNRALSAAEINQNFNAIRGRFTL